MRPEIITILILAAYIKGFMAATPPAYYPSGPQNNVPQTDLVGWLRCWSGNYTEVNTNNTILDLIFERCSGDYLLYGCRQNGNMNLTLLAAGERTAVLTDVGTTSSVVTTNNGVDWYFVPTWSLGFAVEGDGVDRDTCDLASGSYPEKRLCWHSENYGSVPNLVEGYRCGTLVGASTNPFTREIWMQDPCINLNNGDTCDDGNQCTTNDICNAGICTGTPCGTCFECDPNNGCVQAEDGTSCSDDDKCTNNDTCQQGGCAGELVTCSVPQGCFNSTCSALTGQCQDECPPPLTPVAPVTVPIAPPVKVPTAQTSGSERILTLYYGLVLIAASLI